MLLSSKLLVSTVKALVLGAVALAATAAHASDPTPLPDAPSSQWRLEVTPYGWAPFLKGDATIKGRTAAVDFTPVDVLKHLNAVPFMGAIEARRGAFSVYGDIVYANVAGSGSFVRARNFGPVGATVGVSASAEFEQLVMEFGAGYELMKWHSGTSTTTLEVLAGARYWQQQLGVGVDVTGALNIGGLQISGNRAFARSGSVDWVDPLVGFKINHAMSPGQEVFLKADYGGFNVGSDHSWNLMGAYQFEWMVRDGVTYSGLLGYRLLDVDYSQGSDVTEYRYNVLQHGPVMGMNINF